MKDNCYFPFTFEAPVEKFGVGKKRVIWYNVVIVPPSICTDLPLKKFPRLRIEGEIADVPVSNALMPTGDGNYYIIVSPFVLKTAKLELGDVVEIRFRIADQEHVDTPIELECAINSNLHVKQAWVAITPGKKRMLAQHVISAKTGPTKEKRVKEAIAALLDHGADLRAWRNTVRHRS